MDRASFVISAHARIGFICAPSKEPRPGWNAQETYRTEARMRLCMAVERTRAASAPQEGAVGVVPSFDAAGEAANSAAISEG